MKRFLKSSGFILFWIIAFIDILATALHQTSLQFIAKPLLLPLLTLVLFFSSPSGIKKTILIAGLFFSFLGDVFLLFETSNPLFRGFGNQSAEEIERYDQPVLVRLNTRDKDELKTGFPKTPEDLFPYHAIIIDDLEAEFFTPEQMSLLQKYVSERGGSVLMLGGAESFSQGKYQRTPIGDMLPVYLDHADTTTNAPLQVKFNLG